VKSFKDISEKLKKDKDDPCWKGYVQLGTKKKNGKEVPNCVPKESNEVQEKAVSKAQQKFMGMVRAKQKGEMPDASPEVAKAAASMSKKDVKDFAKTKHKGLPAKKESVEIEEASGKDIAAKMMKSKSMKAFAAKVARMPNVSAGDLEKMLPDYVSGAEIRGLFKEVTEGPDYLGDIRRKKEREDRRKAAGHDKETQRQKTMRKVYGNSMVFLKKGYGESVELGEANRNHPAAKKLMALAKQRDAGSDAKDYEKAAQMIMKGDAGQLGRYISRMDSYPRDAVISAVKSTDKAMYDKMVSRMENAEPMNFFEFRQALNEAQLYHNSFSAAVQHAMKQVQKKGYEVDEEDWQRKVASGPSKPSAGKTNRYTVDLMKNGKPVKQKLQMQVYGMDSGKYELNMYVS